MKKLLPTFLSLLFSVTSLMAQQGISLKGKVVDAGGMAIEAATITLLESTSKKLIKIGTTDKTGSFELFQLPAMVVLVQVSVVGFESYQSEAVQLGENEMVELPVIVLKNAEKSLQAVTVTARKPMVEVKADKTVVNVDAFISNAGGTALDVLEKAPGVSVDRDGNISLKGKQGVIVLVDGKQTYLSGQDLANLLRNTPSNQLETVEIMTQPSAKYDASGNSGIINIRTKKGRQNGFNGTVNLGLVQGFYPKSPNSVTINYKKDKLTVFSTLSYSYWAGFNDLELVRKFSPKETETFGSVFDQTSKGKFHNHNAGLRTGIEYAPDKNTTLGFQVNGTYNPREFRANSVAMIYNDGPTAESSNVASSFNKDTWKNLGANFNFRKRLDTTGKELTADLDYIWYGTNALQTSDNYTYRLPQNEVADSFLLRGDLPSDIRIYSFKTDYVHPLNKSSKLEGGLKSSYVTTDNEAAFRIWDHQAKDWATDPTRSNQFIYEENINAAYINYNKEFKKWALQTGLRLEHTYAKGKQVVKNEDFIRNYVQLFPTIFASYKLNDKHTLTANYGRRIERPNYQDMNPFQFFLDQYTFRMGNPNLQPQFTHNIEFSHNFKGILNTTLNYTRTTDVINDILKQNDTTKVTFQTKENIATRRNIGIAISYNQPLTNWWTVSLYGNLFNNYFEGFVNNTPLDASISSFMGNVNNQFKFAKTWGAELSGFYRSKMQEGGLIIARPMGMFSFGLSKQVLKSKGTLKLSVTDPLYVMRFRGSTQFGNIDTRINASWDNRRVALNFSYRFGKVNGGPQRRRTGSATDEQNRVGGGNSQ
jgi:outer membrane receptor protein involved in Fe transport